MNNARSFDLLRWVECRPKLSAQKIVVAVGVSIVLIGLFFCFQVIRFSDMAKEESQTSVYIKQAVLLLQPLLSQGKKDPLVGVLPTESLSAYSNFYPEFEALTHIEIAGLWLEDVTIQRSPSFIKITGATDTSDNIHVFLQQLSLQAAFQNQSFKIMSITAGFLPLVPSHYQPMLSKLHFPTYYHFVIQTGA